ncbi:hypothetical protein B296_00016594 [Ensete ventricosum]|uniref:Uncharacterized protein n=1 Tax=Ensete ventricosum TaxID=4639 RepID=A0A427AJS5_ENSVE|nr:hypothetical protein B296_00016594 [Ensete ventricosum]
MKKCNDHKLFARSRFDRFFGHRLEISKYRTFPLYFPWEVIRARFREKKQWS